MISISWKPDVGTVEAKNSTPIGVQFRSRRSSSASESICPKYVVNVHVPPFGIGMLVNRGLEIIAATPVEVLTRAASSLRTPPLPPRASPHSRVLACGLRGAQRLASTSTAFLLAQR